VREVETCPNGVTTVPRISRGFSEFHRTVSGFIGLTSEHSALNYVPPGISPGRTFKEWGKAHRSHTPLNVRRIYFLYIPSSLATFLARRVPDANRGCSKESFRTPTVLLRASGFTLKKLPATRQIERRQWLCMGEPKLFHRRPGSQQRKPASPGGGGLLSLWRGGYNSC